MPSPFPSSRDPDRALLGVSDSATEKDINKAYRNLAKTCHPDHATDGGEKFRALGDAIERLRRKASKEEKSTKSTIILGSDAPRELSPLNALLEEKSAAESTLMEYKNAISEFKEIIDTAKDSRLKLKATISEHEAKASKLGAELKNLESKRDDELNALDHEEFVLKNKFYRESSPLNEQIKAITEETDYLNKQLQVEIFRIKYMALIQADKFSRFKGNFFSNNKMIDDGKHVNVLLEKIKDTVTKSNNVRTAKAWDSTKDSWSKPEEKELPQISAMRARIKKINIPLQGLRNQVAAIEESLQEALKVPALKAKKITAKYDKEIDARQRLLNHENGQKDHAQDKYDKLSEAHLNDLREKINDYDKKAKGEKESIDKIDAKIIKQPKGELDKLGIRSENGKLVVDVKYSEAGIDTLCDNFRRNYRALLFGQTTRFKKAEFMKKHGEIKENNVFFDLIKSYSRKHPNSRTAKAWHLAETYKDTCHKGNSPLVMSLYAESFAVSGPFKRSKLLTNPDSNATVTCFRSSTFSKKAKKLALDDNSNLEELATKSRRFRKIYNALIEDQIYSEEDRKKVCEFFRENYMRLYNGKKTFFKKSGFMKNLAEPDDVLFLRIKNYCLLNPTSRTAMAWQLSEKHFKNRESEKTQRELADDISRYLR